MANIGVEWPSEDEEFDTVNGSASKSKDSQRQNIAVTDSKQEAPTEDDSSYEEAEAAEEVTVGQKPSFETEETTETPEPVESEAEPKASEEPEYQTPEPEPEAAEEDEPVVVAPVAKPPKAPRKPHDYAGFARIGVELLLIVILIAGALYIVKLRSDRNTLRDEVSKINSDPQSLVQKQSDELVSKVAGLINLPTDETPTVANVTDAAQAKQQSAFFANAQNGDKVLMYAKAGQAILYRPSTNKIILVAPLTFNNAASSAATSTNAKSTTTTPSTSAVTNGSTTTRR